MLSPSSQLAILNWSFFESNKSDHLLKLVQAGKKYLGPLSVRDGTAQGERESVRFECGLPS